MGVEYKSTEDFWSRSAPILCDIRMRVPKQRESNVKQESCCHPWTTIDKGKSITSHQWIKSINPMENTDKEDCSAGRAYVENVCLFNFVINIKLLLKKKL